MPVTITAKDAPGAFVILNRIAASWKNPMLLVYSEADAISGELGLFLTAHSYNTEIRYRAEAEGDDDITPVVVAPKKLKAAVGKAGLVTVEGADPNPDEGGALSSLVVTDEDELTITVKSTFNVESYPASIEEAISGALFASQTVAIADLYDKMEWVSRAISTDEGRPHLASLRIEAEQVNRYAAPGVMVCTDGHRLHLAPGPLYPPEGVLLYAEAVSAILSVMKNQAKKEQYVVFSWGPEGGSMSCGPWEVFFRLNTEARFPPYDKVMPSRTYGATEFDPRKAIKAIDKAKAATDNAIGCDLTFAPGKMIFEARDAEGQGVDVALPAKTNMGEFKGGILVNMDYLKQAVAVPGDSVLLSVSVEELDKGESTIDPVLIQHELGTAINMPMRK